MNIDHAVDKEWESKTLSELAKAPISALQGISDEGGRKIAEGLRIKDNLLALANCKTIRWAQAIVALAEKED